VYALLKEPDPLERTAEIARRLQGLGPDAIGQVRAAYDAFFVDSGDVAIVLLAEWWARLDPTGAFEWARGEWIGRHPAVVMAVVYAWATRDPEEAGRAVEGITNPTLQRACLEALVGGWDESGRPGLLDYLADLSDDADQQRSIALLMRRRVRRDGFEETFRWAEALPDEPAPLKLNVFRRLASAAAELEPNRAAAWAERHSGGEHGKGLFRRVGVRWAGQDGRAAMAWLATLPAGWERDVGVQEAYRTWLSRDHENAMAWMRGAELEPWLEPAFVLFTVSLSRKSPEEALEWAGRLRDEERRREAFMKIGRVWHLADPDAAQAWLDRSELSEKDRNWVLEPRQQPRRRAAPLEP
jgi:hypothetical protein